MKLTKSTLKRLIKEEIESLLNEGNWWDDAVDAVGGAAAAATAIDAIPSGSGYGEETDDEMAAAMKAFSDPGADALDSPENRELFQNLFKVETDVKEYIKNGEFDAGRQHVNAAWKSGAFGKNPKFAKAQWRRLRRMVANAKRKAGRRSRSSVNRDALDKMGAKEDPRFPTPTPEEIAKRKGFLPGSPEFKKSVAASTSG